MTDFESKSVSVVRIPSRGSSASVMLARQDPQWTVGVEKVAVECSLLVMQILYPPRVPCNKGSHGMVWFRRIIR